MHSYVLRIIYTDIVTNVEKVSIFSIVRLFSSLKLNLNIINGSMTALLLLDFPFFAVVYNSQEIHLNGLVQSFHYKEMQIISLSTSFGYYGANSCYKWSYRCRIKGIKHMLNYILGYVHNARYWFFVIN